MQKEVLELLSGRRGHFLLESGHHGDFWLDLETLCLKPRPAQALAARLTAPLADLHLDAVCGPLVEGAFVALLVALQLDTQFTYSERFVRPAADGLFPAGYRVPASLRDGLRGKRVAIVNDVINAGSAIKGTFADLEDCGANILAISTLLVLGSSAAEFAASKNVPLHTIATLPNNLWTASECPLCDSGIPLQDVAAYATTLRK
jgi:orotate phosphoribosyltransferase